MLSIAELMVQKAMETVIGKICHDLAPRPSPFCSTVHLTLISSHIKENDDSITWKLCTMYYECVRFRTTKWNLYHVLAATKWLSVVLKQAANSVESQILLLVGKLTLKR